MQQHRPILVLGATGKTGRRVAERLEARGLPVRRASRSSATRFDWEDERTWAPALAGARAAYISYVPDLAMPEAPGRIEALTRAAVAAGLERLVLLSGRGEPNAQRCEEIVRASGLETTVVRASWFAQNFAEGVLLGPVLAGTLALPAGRVREPLVDVDDIADVAVAALTEDGHAGELYEVTGPRLLGFDEVAATISAAAGRPLRYVDVSPAEFRAGLERELGPEMAGLLGELVAQTLDGRNERLGDGVERALGRPPRDFAESCRAMAASGAWALQPA